MNFHFNTEASQIFKKSLGLKLLIGTCINLYYSQHSFCVSSWTLNYFTTQVIKYSLWCFAMILVSFCRYFSLKNSVQHAHLHNTQD